jgi:hypothetical protein
MATPNCKLLCPSPAIQSGQELGGCTLIEANDGRTISNEIVELTGKLRKRSRRAVIEAWFYLFCTIVVGIGLVYYFTTYGGIFAKYASVAVGGSGSYSTVEVKVDPGTTFPAQTDWEVLISQIVTRLGAVFIAIFVMQALISFSRYKFRLSGNLARAADICEGSGGVLERMQLLSQIYLVDLGDISQFIQSPTDKVLDLVKDAVAKIPKL